MIGGFQVGAFQLAFQQARASVAQAAAFSTDPADWYVIDYRVGRRRVTPDEWRRLLQMFEIWKRSRGKWLEEQRANREIERRLGIKVPPMRVDSATAEFFDRKLLQGPRVSGRGVRPDVREHPERATNIGGPDKALYVAPRVRGWNRRGEKERLSRRPAVGR